MIPANELRLGNLVYDQNDKMPPSPMIIEGVLRRVIHLKDIDHPMIWETNPDQLMPISITGDWVKRLGFELDPDEDRFDGYVYDKYSLGICDVYFDDKDDDCPRIYFDGNLKSGEHDNVDCEMRIKYVHQLQNLFFYIAGCELTAQQMN